MMDAHAFTRSLGLKPGLDFSGPISDALKTIEKYELDFLESKLRSDGKLAAALIPEAIFEFRRFMSLVAFDICPLAMIGNVVDEVWHQFILFTPQYKRFCCVTVGKFISHQPNTMHTPIPLSAAVNFVEGYRAFFGEIPRVWFHGAAPELYEWTLSRDLRDDPPRRWSGWTGED